MSQMTATTSPFLPAALPDCHMGDPAELAAWYGPFGWSEHLRKVVLSNCEELVRADYAAREQPKPPEDRIKALAHTHTIYVSWLVDNLQGRVLYEREVLKRGLEGRAER